MCPRELGIQGFGKFLAVRDVCRFANCTDFAGRIRGLVGRPSLEFFVRSGSRIPRVECGKGARARLFGYCGRRWVRLRCWARRAERDSLSAAEMSVPRASISAGAGMWAFMPQPLPELVRIGDRVAALSFDWHACLDPMLCCRLANSEIRANSLPAFESLGRLFGFC